MNDNDSNPEQPWPTDPGQPIRRHMTREEVAEEFSKMREAVANAFDYQTNAQATDSAPVPPVDGSPEQPTNTGK